jgi:hypothetical protein
MQGSSRWNAGRGGGSCGSLDYLSMIICMPGCDAGKFQGRICCGGVQPGGSGSQGAVGEELWLDSTSCCWIECGRLCATPVTLRMQANPAGGSTTACMRKELPGADVWHQVSSCVVLGGGCKPTTSHAVHVHILQSSLGCAPTPSPKSGLQLLGIRPASTCANMWC